VDARHDHPFLRAPYPACRHSHTDGDVLSRFLVRAEEIAHSIEMITGLVGELDGRLADEAPLVDERAGYSGLGITEGWRGTIVHRVEFASDGTLFRVKIVDPSFFNWPALPVALTDTIVPDFPLVN